MVPANFDALSDDELIEHIEKAKRAVATTPDGPVKKWIENDIRAAEQRLQARRAKVGSPSPQKASVAAGTRASHVSTTVANTGSVSPVNVSSPTQAVAANMTPTPAPTVAQTTASASAQSQAVIRNAAGHGTPPAGSVPTPARSAGGITEELMEAAKSLSKRVYAGAKGSKNLRAAGVAALASAAGFGMGKMKNRTQNAPDKAQLEYNREQALKQSLMSDG